MLEKIKNIGWTGLGMLFFVLVVFVIIFLIKGGVSFIENHQDLIESINQIIIGIIFLLLVISVIPKLRIFTGTSIVYLTFLWAFMVWLTCLAITYELWGLIGMFIGVIMLGLGIFITAPLALLFAGQWSATLILLLSLGIIYGVRMLGLWIASKHRNIIEVTNIDTDSLKQLEPKDNKNE